MRDEINPEFLFQMTHTELLVKIAAGEIDPRALALTELANRGFDLSGTWVGFPKAAAIARAAIAGLNAEGALPCTRPGFHALLCDR